METASEATKSIDPKEQVRDWGLRLSALRDALGEIEATTAIDFCELALAQLKEQVKLSPPLRGTAANILVMDVMNVSVGFCARSGIEEDLSASDARLAITATIDRAIGEIEGWIASSLPNDAEIARRFDSATTGMEESKEELESTVAARHAEDDAASKHGAVLGYSDPTVDAKVIYTQVCEFSSEEHERYSTAYQRLTKKLNRDLLRYVQDSVGVFREDRQQALVALADGSFPMHNPDLSDEFAHRIRSATLTASNAFHIHQMQTYWAAQDSFGKPSTEYAKLTELFHGLYSGCHGYRWLLELRHTMLHISMEAASLRVAVEVDQDPTVAVTMDRGWMKESSGVMDKAYKRTELLAMTSDPSVVTMIDQALPALTTIQEQIDKVLFPDLAGDAATVRELIGRFQGRRGTYALQLGPGFTPRLRIPPMRRLSPRVLSYADGYPIGTPTS
ncbi:hypothetical protein DBV08_01940 [Rhodococcus sp. KBW08]|uniref:hypothetical protein n=1 Tax=Rhodococcus sp. KBW08 TaxID=2144188 RepID=UPI000F5AF7F3|nr:hypothetical protein [Rhodococcus sp. KBW08]RQO51903.1 hypothetical protein DBV08_01940 [Rhodococcus sp. KBW08]